MADSIGAIGSNDDKLAALKKMRMYNPADKAGGKGAGAFLAQITAEDFAKNGYVSPPGLTEGGSCFNT